MPEQSLAPVYRYFTVDLLTNEILAEIPLRGVSYECTLKAAGKFQGSIPITAETDSMDLYNSTMPGNTAIFAVRNGKCVWGGIIWSRTYQFSTKDLAISASEFTSYFYHRKIWKTFNHQYGGTVTYDADNGWRTLFDYGSNGLAKVGSTVKLEFFEPENMKYNGYYRVADTPSPTTSGFTMVGGFAVADITTTEKRNGWYIFYTRENHGYTTGDSVTITLTSEDGVPLVTPTTFEGVVDAPAGAASSYFRVATAPTTQALMVVEGTAARTLPVGTYSDVTITLRQDAFDYIRTLIDAMFDDFVTTDFPNVYIEPGISYALPVISKEATNGFAIIKTDRPHGVAPGQAIQVQDVDGVFDGEYEITDTPAADVLVYERGGTVAQTAVSPITATISAVFMSDGIATLTTTASHGFSLGQNVTISIGDPYGDFAGTFPVMEIPTATKFRYDTGTGRSYSATTLAFATTTVAGDPVNEVTRVEVNSNVVTLELKDDVVYSVGDSVAVANVNRDLVILEKSLDAPNGKAIIQTAEDHGLAVGDVVSITGLYDYVTIVSKVCTTSSVTMTTDRPHNIRKTDVITIEGTDSHKITNKALTSNVATLTTSTPHNTPVGALITVTDLIDSANIQDRKLLNNVATITTTATHNFQVNDPIHIAGLDDRYTIVAKEALRGVVTLTLATAHNILPGSKIKVTGVGVPFDGTEIVVDDVTATRISYQIDDRYWGEKRKIEAAKGRKLAVPTTVPPAKASGTVRSIASFYNGDHVVIARTGTTIQFSLVGNDEALKIGTGTLPKVTGPSVFCGTYTVTARTASTLSYAKTAANVTSTAVKPPVKDTDIQPLITLDTVHGGSRTITAVTSNTFTFSQTMPSASAQKTLIEVLRKAHSDPRPPHVAILEARKASVFNGTRTITAVTTTDRFAFSLTGFSANILEEGGTKPAFARATGIYNGTFTITTVDPIRNTISYAKTTANFGSKPVLSRGRASVDPMLVISTFGPFPGNADMGMRYLTRSYTGINLDPTMYRGFELKSVGEALDAYSDNINGFEYRIDCDYDEEANKFTKTFVMLPINFPNPPPPGEVAPLSRYGADTLIFEYPGGNIVEVSIDESAEDSATRFFATGESDLGPDVGPNIGIASSQDLLTGRNGRKWPLLDATESISGVSEEEDLYAFAQRYLSEAAPPYAKLSVSLNGSIAPLVGDYKPGDWCSLILDDPFIRMRLQSGLEPRDDIIVRKISSFQVKVPDAVTFPETVTLDLVAEWEVDTRGQ